MSPGRKFRQLLKDRPFIFTPGITTPLHAMIVEKAGFEYAYVGGYDVSLTLLGVPDVGLITENEMVANAGYIAQATSLPVIVDADTGYGNAINTIRAVRNFERAGVAGIHIEDQLAPKKCGHVAGKQLISTDEMVGKLRAALDARRDKDFVIIARTDAVSAYGGSLEAAIERGIAYARAGADMVWSEFPSTGIEPMRDFAAGIHGQFPDLPLYLNYSSNLDWHETSVSFDDIAALGYKAMLTSLAGLRTSLMAMWDYSTDLRARGAAAETDFHTRFKAHEMGPIYDFAGFPGVRELEEKYLPAEELKKYEDAGE